MTLRDKIEEIVQQIPPEALQWIIILLLAPSLLWLIIQLILSVM
jgi:uncharacterized YccA/Bax inhibitor family protein